MKNSAEKNLRIIARLDIKGETLIKGVNLEGLRIIGNPHEFALDYYSQGIDEIIYMDIVASLYGRSKLTHVVEKTARNVFVPLTVGGGIRSIDDVTELLRAGADKVAINTAALENPKLITQVAEKFGSQCMVISIEAKNLAHNHWEAYSNSGREPSGVDVVAWAKKSVELGAGEILLTSIDNEGTGEGFDLQLIESIESAVNVPIIASGGFRKQDHLKELNRTCVDAIAIADALHYRRCDVQDIRNFAQTNGFRIRRL